MPGTGKYSFAIAICVVTISRFCNFPVDADDSKLKKRCTTQNELPLRPGMACECDEDPIRSVCFITKRYAYDMKCIDCPPGQYFRLDVNDCRPCPNPKDNCYKRNHERTTCKPCVTTEQPTANGRTTEQPTTTVISNTFFMSTDTNDVSFSTMGEITTSPESPEDSPDPPLVTTPATVSTARSPTQPEDLPKMQNDSTDLNVIFTATGAVLLVAMVMLAISCLVWRRCVRPVDERGHQHDAFELNPLHQNDS